MFAAYPLWNNLLWYVLSIPYDNKLMILLIDNYDSFTYNLVQRLGEMDATLDIEVHRNDQITADEVQAKQPSHIIISPGPCTPNEAGQSMNIIEQLRGAIPI